MVQLYEISANVFDGTRRDLGVFSWFKVASRVQKYFIKLGKVQMPIPGRLPNRTHLKVSQVVERI